MKIINPHQVNKCQYEIHEIIGRRLQYENQFRALCFNSNVNVDIIGPSSRFITPITNNCCSLQVKVNVPEGMRDRARVFANNNQLLYMFWNRHFVLASIISLMNLSWNWRIIWRDNQIVGYIVILTKCKSYCFRKKISKWIETYLTIKFCCQIVN